MSIQFIFGFIDQLCNHARIGDMHIPVEAPADFHCLAAEDVVSGGPGHLQLEGPSIETHDADAVELRECRQRGRVEERPRHNGPSMTMGSIGRCTARR